MNSVISMVINLSSGKRIELSLEEYNELLRNFAVLPDYIPGVQPYKVPYYPFVAPSTTGTEFSV